MKTILITLSLLISILGYSQKCEYNKIGVENKYSNSNVIVYSSQYSYIEYKDGYYELYIGDKDKSSYKIIVNVKYDETDTYSTPIYAYKGLLMSNEVMYNCSIETKTKLSDYTKCVVNGNEINIYYWDIGIKDAFGEKIKIVLIK